MAIAAPIFTYGKPKSSTTSTSLTGTTIKSGPAAGSVIYTPPVGVHPIIDSILRSQPSDHPLISLAKATTTTPNDPYGIAKLIAGILTPAQLQALATKNAKDTIAGLVAPYLAQERTAQERAAQQAADIRAASAAAAQRLVPLAGQTDAVYKDAANQLAAYSQGYSGQTRADATAEAAKLQPALDAMHSGQTALNTGDALGNVLLGLGGEIPATPLEAARVAAFASNTAFPGQLRSAGEQTALGAITAGNQRVQDLIDQSLGVSGQLPQLIHQYLSDYSTANQNSIDTAIKLTQLGRGNTKIQSLGNGQFAVVSLNPDGSVKGIATVGQGIAKTTVTSLGRGGFVTTTTRPDGTTVQTTVPGQPYPGKSWLGKDGVYHVISQDGKTVIDYGTPVVTPQKPIIKGSPTTGYDVFDQSGNIISHIAARPGASKPVIRTNSVKGGYDVFQNGKLVRHIAGPVPPGAASAATARNKSAISMAQGFANAYHPAVQHKNAKGQVTSTTAPGIAPSFKDAYGQVVQLGDINDPQWRAQAFGIVKRAYAKLIPQIIDAVGAYAFHNYDATGKDLGMNKDGSFTHTQDETTKAMIQAGLPADLATEVVAALYQGGPVIAKNVAVKIRKTLNSVWSALNRSLGGTGQPQQTSYHYSGPNPPAELMSATTSAEQKYGLPPGILLGIWKIESGGSYPNPFANGLGYGGEFGTRMVPAFGPASQQTRVIEPPVAQQADTAASILARLIKEKGSLSAALYAYSGGGYSSV